MRVSYDVVWITNTEFLGFPTHRAHFLLREFAARGQRCCLVSVARSRTYGEYSVWSNHIPNESPGRPGLDIVVLPQLPLFGPGYHTLESLTLLSELAARGSPTSQTCIASGPWAGLVAAALRSTGKSSTFIYDDADFYSAEFGGISAKLVRFMERACLRMADSVVTTNEALRNKRLEDTNREIAVIPNGGYRISRQREKQLHARPTFAYIGGLTADSGVAMLIDSANVLKESAQDFKVVVMGSGPLEATLRQKVTRWGLNRWVEISGFQPRQTVQAVLGDSHAGIIPLPPTGFNRYRFPIKLGEYVCSGLPTISTPIPAYDQFLRSLDIGIVVDPTPEAIADACLELASNPPRRTRMETNCIRAARGLAWDQLADRFLEHIAMHDKGQIRSGPS